MNLGQAIVIVDALPGGEESWVYRMFTDVSGLVTECYRGPWLPLFAPHVPVGVRAGFRSGSIGERAFKILSTYDRAFTVLEIKTMLVGVDKKAVACAMSDLVARGLASADGYKGERRYFLREEEIG